MSERPTFGSQTIGQLLEFLKAHDIKPYRAAQIQEWYFKKHILSWDDMTNIPKELRALLANTFSLFALEKAEEQQSCAKDSTKYLFKAADSQFIETVLIRSSKRNTVCLSTQIGCKFGCSFCASGKAGFVRNLKSEEIIDQFILARNLGGFTITNVVFMGMGEPFDNYDNTANAINVLTAQDKIGIGARRITVSTVGYVPGIKKFSQHSFSQIKLSISLHAVNDELRGKLMPGTQRYPLNELVACLREVREHFKREITLEYILLKGVNDSAADMKTLSRIAKQLKAKVNLIGYNPVTECGYTVPDKADLLQQQTYLESLGIRTTIRHSAGSNISAACGQLRLSRDKTT